ncbi:BON domain-containing protein [Streptomyces sp. TRM72054]|uniref:BON domain-containing protein n=1 Tax=Streptomyces TaxID=1883 RepID=UPI001487E1D2|nr:MULTISPECIES: BON domain-containing protein [Streptomyces]MBX9399006.1 BON domain-containing protein [Streptomyces sp. TRM72054]
MTGPDAQGAPGAPAPEHLEYRVAHLRDRLAAGDLGELGVRIEVRGEAVLLTGTVPSARCRDDVRRLAEEALAGLPVHYDLQVTDSSSPDHAEELA